MNIQQLFQSIQNEKDAFIDFYLTYDSNTSNRDAVEKLFDDICNYQDVIENKDCIVFSVPEFSRYELTNIMHSFAVNKTELLIFFDKIHSGAIFDARLETYAYDYTSIKEILGYQVSEACMYAFKNIYRYLASILYEISFHGYDLTSRDIAVKNELEYLNQAVANIDENNTCADLEDLFENDDLIDQFAAPDDPEILFEIEFADSFNRFSEQLLKQLYCLEASYLIENGDRINA